MKKPKTPKDVKKDFDRKIANSVLIDGHDYKKLDLYLKSAILEQLMIINERTEKHWNGPM